MVKRILFTLTTVLSREDKKNQTFNALKSIHNQEPNLKKYSDVIVINECGSNGQYLKKMFPWITKVIDKGNTTCGQSNSLNIAIDLLRKKPKYKYWIHWEESWICTKPFIKVCLESMERGVDQLQLVEGGWEHDYDFRIKLPKTKRYIKIQSKDIPYEHYSNCLRKGKNKFKKFQQDDRCWEEDPDKPWPIWSLRPGMDRVEKVLNVGYFNTDKNFWPVHFELEWAYNWVMQPGGIVKAGVICGKRQTGHKSFSLGEI